jgi:hypothetical protein
MIRRWLGLHEWKYRNPFDRTCNVCGRHEVAFSWAWDWSRTWWEVHTYGNKSAHD